MSWFWFGRKFSLKMAKIGHLCVLLDTLTPRCRSACLGVKAPPRVSALSGPPRRSSSLPRQTSPLRRSIASRRRACKSCFGSSLLLILTIIY